MQCLSSHRFPRNPLILCAVALAMFCCQLAVAQKKQPLLIQYNGRLMSGASPITTPQKIRVKIIDIPPGAVGGEKMVFSQTEVVRPDANGAFTMLIGEKPDAGFAFRPDLVLSSSRLFVEVVRIIGSKQEIVQPRQEVVSLAFALQSMGDQKVGEAARADEATHAKNADDALRSNEAVRAKKADEATHAQQADRAATADRAMSADRAVKADDADKAQLADKAVLADRATVADRALSAATASHADKAGMADKAEQAETAQRAASADRAEHAVKADHASRADEATKSSSAAIAARADLAVEAEHAKKADEATTAKSTMNAEKAATADHALKADVATTAESTENADYAKNAGIAAEALKARRTGRADTAQVALYFGGKGVDDFLTRPLQKKDLENEVVTTKSIAPGAVNTTHIKDGSITGIKIAKGAITGDMIKDGSIPQSKMQPVYSARKLRQPGQPPQIDSVDVTGNLSVSGNLFHRYGTLYTPLIRADGYIFSRFLSGEGVLFAVKGSVTGANGNAVEGSVQTNIGSSFLASGFGDFIRGQRFPQISSDPVIFRISNRADMEVRNRANEIIYSFTADSAHPTLKIGGEQSNGSVFLTNGAGEEGVYMTGGIGKNSASLRVQGTISVRGKELEVHDYAEVFEMENREQLQPGHVVVIDPAAPGRLRLATVPCDRLVAGVISGGDASTPGVMLGVRSDGSTDKPVALAGRVYCYADASFGEIQPGDLLTSSSTPGHAMRVSNMDAARSAIIGKAMEGLKEGKGRIMILVTLQ